MPAAHAAPAVAGGQADPYAMCKSNLQLHFPVAMVTDNQADGGYENYLALWYQSVAAQQTQGPGGASQAPGTS